MVLALLLLLIYSSIQTNRQQELEQRLNHKTNQLEKTEEQYTDAIQRAEAAEDAKTDKAKKLKQKAQQQRELRREVQELKEQLQAKRKSNAVHAAAPTQESSNTSCAQAVKQTWPSSLQQSALVVLNHENRQHDPTAISAVNHHPDGSTSQDFGCFQINNKYHSSFFANNNWRDPVASANYAFNSIYKPRGDFTAWYAVQGILW